MAADETDKSSEPESPVSGLAVLDFIGFQLTSATPAGVFGKFVVSPNSCQPFGVLHGGVSAYIAEATASMGAQIASNWERVAGIELNINHLQPASLGQEVTVEAVPLHRGKRIQVWEVKLLVPPKGSRSGPSVVAVSRVTVIVGLPNPAKGAHFKDIVEARAKL